MTIPTIDTYTGDLPDIGAGQTAFDAAMATLLPYLTAAMPGGVNATVEGINTFVQQLAALESSDFWGAPTFRTVVRLTSASFYEAGNHAGEYPAGRAVVLAQTASGVGFVTSATYNAGATRTEVTVTGITVDTGLTQAVLGLDPTYAPLPTAMTGATSGSAGTRGSAPAPAAGDQGKFLAGAAAWLYPLIHGQCRLIKSGANLLLSRVGLGFLVINGVAQVVPVAGVSLAPTGQTPNTLYYIYAYMNGANMALEASTTGHSQDATTGVEIKTGDASRTLVGMARCVTGPAWADTAQQRLVSSYFNRADIEAVFALGSSRSTSSGTLTELSAADRIEFLAWGDDGARVGCIALTTAASAGNVRTGVYVDGSILNRSYTYADAAGSNSSIPATKVSSEGYHYASIYGGTSGPTASWQLSDTKIFAHMRG